MLSAGLPFPVFEGGFTPWDQQDSLFHYLPEEPPFPLNNMHEPIIPNLSGSYEQNEPYESIRTGSMIDERKHEAIICQYPQGESPFSLSHINEPAMSNLSGSERLHNEPNYKTGTIVEERKRKRMISNRESARRSRKKKQKLLVDLTKQVNQYEGLNQELRNRVDSVTCSCQFIEKENSMLELESGFLRQRLWTVRQVLIARDIEKMQSNHLTTVTNESNNFNQNVHLLNI